MFARFSNMVTNLFIMTSVIQEEDKELSYVRLMFIAKTNALMR